MSEIESGTESDMTDSESEEPMTRCDGSLVGPPPVEQSFNFLAFAKLRDFENRFLKETRRMLLKAGIQIPHFSYYTDDVLHELLTRTYGPLDKETEEYEIIFRQFRTSKFEQLAEWEKEESDSAYLSEPNRIKELRDEFFQTFTLDQIELINLNPFINKAKADWFNLPRPAFTIEKNMGYIPPGAEQTLNLALFDPLFEIEVNYGWSDKSDSHSISPKARLSLAEDLANFPLGIAPSVLFGNSESTKLTIPMEYRYWASESKNLTEFIKDAEDIGWIQEENGIPGYLLFPTHLQGSVPELNGMLKRIWHLVKVILGLNDGFARIEDILTAHKKYFGEKFPLNPEDWALGGLSEVIRICAVKWPDPEILLVPIIHSELENMLNGPSMKSELYLLRIKTANPQFSIKIKRRSKKRKPIGFEILSLLNS